MCWFKDLLGKSIRISVDYERHMSKKYKGRIKNTAVVIQIDGQTSFLGTCGCYVKDTPCKKRGLLIAMGRAVKELERVSTRLHEPVRFSRGFPTKLAIQTAQLLIKKQWSSIKHKPRTKVVRILVKVPQLTPIMKEAYKSLDLRVKAPRELAL